MSAYPHDVRFAPESGHGRIGGRQTYANFGFAALMSALPPKADIGTHPRNVRFVPKADEVHRSKKTAHVHHAHRRFGRCEFVWTDVPYDGVIGRWI